MATRQLGTVAASEQLISDLYLSLRRVINYWAPVTKQTAQARMGYVGQHLVSVVTGYPGGKSSPLGRDLLMLGDDHAEIKICNRVDQLRLCRDCGAIVSGIELGCPNCGRRNFQRRGDSKWLFVIRNDDDFAAIWDPTSYYLVLFDFVEADLGLDVQAWIWRVDPKCPGFALCMVDYYLNIRANSRSSAPFNLWPFMLKFYLMRPVLIYRSLISPDDTIYTERFPGRDAEKVESVLPLAAYAQSRNLSPDKIGRIARQLGATDDARQGKSARLELIEEFATEQGYDSDRLTDLIAVELYRDEVSRHLRTLPDSIARWMPELG